MELPQRSAAEFPTPPAAQSLLRCVCAPTLGLGPGEEGGLPRRSAADPPAAPAAQSLLRCACAPTLGLGPGEEGGLSHRCAADSPAAPAVLRCACAPTLGLGPIGEGGALGSAPAGLMRAAAVVPRAVPVLAAELSLRGLGWCCVFCLGCCCLRPRPLREGTVCQLSPSCRMARGADNASPALAPPAGFCWRGAGRLPAPRCSLPSMYSRSYRHCTRWPAAAARLAAGISPSLLACCSRVRSTSTV